LDLARTRPGIVVLHHPQHLGPTKVINDDTLHMITINTGRTVGAESFDLSRQGP
jgi:hypothetical protein